MTTIKLDKMKEWALKSGYPFENDVLIEINQCMPDSLIRRNLEFETKNEEGNSAIRSVDFLVTIKKQTRNIPDRNWPKGTDEYTEVNFIIDGKYCSDESFLFIPSHRPITERSYPALIPCLLKDGFGRDVRFHRQDIARLAVLPSHVPTAASGRKVKEQSKERDSLASALLQVTQGLEVILRERASSLGEESQADSSYIRNIHFFVPIIVTNSRLFRLKGQKTVQSIEAATDQTEFIEEVDLVAVDMPDIFDLKHAWTSLKQALKNPVNEKLGWKSENLSESPIIFCNLTGLKWILKEWSTALANVPTEPK